MVEAVQCVECLLIEQSRERNDAAGMCEEMCISRDIEAVFMDLLASVSTDLPLSGRGGALSHDAGCAIDHTNRSGIRSADA